MQELRSYGTLDPKPKGYSDEFKDMVMQAYYERVSVRGIQRIFGIHPTTLYRWLLELAEKLPEVAETLDEAHPTLNHPSRPPHCHPIALPLNSPIEIPLENL